MLGGMLSGRGREVGWGGVERSLAIIAKGLNSTGLLLVYLTWPQMQDEHSGL